LNDGVTEEGKIEGCHGGHLDGVSRPNGDGDKDKLPQTASISLTFRTCDL